MPSTKFAGVKICASSRVIAKLKLLNGEEVKAGGGVPRGSPKVQMPITGWAFPSLASALSSRAVTAIERVRLACAGSKKYALSPYPLSEPTQSPAGGTGAGVFQLSEAAHCGTGCALRDIRMSCARSTPAATVTTMG